MTKKSLIHLLPVLSVCFIAALAVTQRSAQAYLTIQRWTGTSTEYVTDASVGQSPFPSTAPGLVNTAAARWSQGSTGIPFTIVNFNGQIGPTRMRVATANFAALGFPNDPGNNALTFLSSGRLASSLLRLNNTWTWNTTCTLNQAQKKADVMTIVLHEMGHSVALNHHSAHTEAVMWPNYVCKQTLRTDDKNGIDALY